MLTKRIIPCLDIKEGRTVKGINFEQLRDAGDPVELGALYALQGADELTFLDITATLEARNTLIDLVKRIAKEINIPFTVGGGVRTVVDVGALLQAGADKITINSAAVNQPDVITAMAREFGSQCIVVAIDTKLVNGEWIVHTHGGTRPTNLETVAWAREIEQRGGGEILLTSMNNDGTKDGFALDITRRVSENTHIPVIASGGAGKMEHFVDVFSEGKADAGLAASIFHFKEIGIPELKQYLKKQHIPIRL
ncbi:MAG: imidazole glycerol phosphate synthase subunit HisF [Flavobacteriales bacterium]|nr:imidazole glycerol phosphate synthase subunit HisF [Flavobacteriales bacterium]MCB9449769.1 imidazole glycerol phosphate synthase subunit HisF [Flavobacteriales bacterium]